MSYRNQRKWWLWIGRLLTIIAIFGAQGTKASENLHAVGRKAGSSESPISLKAARLTGFSIVETQGACRAELIGDGPIAEYNCFTLENPRRIVLDIQGFRHPFNNRHIHLGSKIVDQLRIGIHPSKVRFVFDIAESLDRWPSHKVQAENLKLVLSIYLKPDNDGKHVRTSILSQPATHPEISPENKLQTTMDIQKHKNPPGTDALHTIQEVTEDLGTARLKDEELSSIRAVE